MAFRIVEPPNEANQPEKQPRFRVVEPPNSTSDTLSNTLEDVAKQTAYQGLRGTISMPGNLLDFVQNLAASGLRKLGIDEDALALAKRLTSSPITPLGQTAIPTGPLGLPTTQTVDQLARRLNVNPEAQTASGRIAGNIAETLSSAGVGGVGTRGLAALGTGAAIGQGIREAGGPEELATSIELGSALLGSRGQGKLVGTKKQREAIDFLKKYGLTEEQITPVLQSDVKLGFLRPFIKGKRTKQAASNLIEGLGNIYDDLKAAGSYEILAPTRRQIPLQNIYEIRDSLPLRWQRSVREAIQVLQNSRQTGKDYIKFFQDINAEIGDAKGSKQVINLLKQPVREALFEMNPELGKDFDLVNQFYSKAKTYQKAVKPGLFDEFINAGKTLGIASALMSGNYKILAGLIGTQGAKILAQQMITNPRLQNLWKRLGNAVAKNNRALTTQIVKQIGKEVPEIQDQLEEN